jgi:hypothetical protein
MSPPTKLGEDMPDNVRPWLLRLTQAVLNSELPTSFAELEARKLDYDKHFGLIAAPESWGGPTSHFPAKDAAKCISIPRAELEELMQAWKIRPKFLFKDAR